MRDRQVFDRTQFFDRPKMSRLNGNIMIFRLFIVLFDGYDIRTVVPADPSLAKESVIANIAKCRTAFSAGLFGILPASLLVGGIGDRDGRSQPRNRPRPTDHGRLQPGDHGDDLAAPGHRQARFHGLQPWRIAADPIARNAKFAPKRLCATMIIISFTGIRRAVPCRDRLRRGTCRSSAGACSPSPAASRLPSSRAPL